MAAIFENRRFERMVCGECGIEWWVPDAWHQNQKNLGPRGGFHCPNGHSRVFRESDVDILTRERNQLKQGQARYEEWLADERRKRETAERRASAARGQVTKLKKRAANGICPCCNRSFANLQRHMASQHPGFISEPTADEHVH